jgi:hypothetical protein
VRRAGQDALRLQDLERFAQRNAAHLQHGGEIDLDQPFAGLERS